MAFCINCGNQISEEAKFCPSCGQSTAEETLVGNEYTEGNLTEPKEIIIRGTEGFPLLEFVLGVGDKVLVESGSMVYHNGKVNLEGKMNNNGTEGFGGVLKAVGRSVVSGESMFITHVTGRADDSRITIAPPVEGKIIQVDVGEKQWRLNDGAFLASTEGVGYNSKTQDVSKALFGGTGGLFIQETHGQGKIFFSAYGDIEEIDFDDTVEELVIDNQHVVAWQTTLDYSIESASGTLGVMSGEGAVTRFRGKGKIYIQTRSLANLAETLKDLS